MTGPLLASGREADVYALDDQRVLRRYRREADVTGEVATMRYLAGLGYQLPPWPGAAPGSSILHLDLHPENVLMTARGPVVIDWCNARPGDPDLDTGLSALILAQVVTGDELLTAFLRAAPGEPTRLLDEVVRFRDWQLQGTVPLDAATERVLACAR